MDTNQGKLLRNPLYDPGATKKPLIAPPKFTPNIVQKKRKLDEEGAYTKEVQEINKEPFVPKRKFEDRRRFNNRPQGERRIQQKQTATPPEAKPTPQPVAPLPKVQEPRAITYDKSNDQRQSRTPYREYGANKYPEKKVYQGPAPYRSISPYRGNRSYDNYRPRSYSGNYRNGYNNNYQYNKRPFSYYNRRPYGGNFRYNNYRGSNGYQRYNNRDGRYQPKEYKKPDADKEVKCPNCQKMHKISTFCPYTGDTMRKDRQLALN
jgi:hypothetical protein